MKQGRDDEKKERRKEVKENIKKSILNKGKYTLIEYLVKISIAIIILIISFTKRFFFA